MKPLARGCLTLAGLALVLQVPTIPAAAQGWSVDTFLGRVDYANLPAATDSGSVGIRFNQDRRLFEAVVGMPLSGEDLTWGVLQFGDRAAFRRGGTVAGVDVSLFGQAYRDPMIQMTGYGLLTEVMPVFSRSVGPGVLEISSGSRWYGARLGTQNWSRSFWTTEFRAGLDAAENLRLDTELRHERGGNSERYTRAGLRLTTALGPLRLQGSVGAWVDGPADTDPEWGASLAVPLRSNLWLFTTASHESFNPHFLNPTRTSWGAGLSWQIGGSRPAAGPEVRSGGNVVIRLPLREADTAPFVAGDFNDWVPVRMTRLGDQWRLALKLGSGVYHYAFRSADGEWFVPDSVGSRVPDGMGGLVAVLVVP